MSFLQTDSYASGRSECLSQGNCFSGKALHKILGHESVGGRVDSAGETHLSCSREWSFADIEGLPVGVLASSLPARADQARKIALVVIHNKQLERQQQDTRKMRSFWLPNWTSSDCLFARLEWFVSSPYRSGLDWLDCFSSVSCDSALSIRSATSCVSFRSNDFSRVNCLNSDISLPELLELLWPSS